MERGQALRFLCVWKVDAHIGSWRYNVELGIEHIDTIDDTVEPRHSEGSMALILAYCMPTAKSSVYTVKITST